ncbi:MAG: Universal stress protein family protein [Verrucomicrobiales bacterium]|nr:Universal stress protein family protein [Verrucomicrobiales bacterium]
MEPSGVHRPRNVGWARAAALLYGDWGTSKAYVIGFAFSSAFAIASYQALPIIIAVCALTGLVAYNYILVCKHFPDGGGVYSAAREQSRFLAVMGALLLVANFTVTAAMSCWAAMNYFRVPEAWVPAATVGCILLIVAINCFGPKHSGSFAMSLAAPMLIVVVLIIAWSLPHLSTKNLQPLSSGFGKNWLAFTGMILALSGVEAIANLTGVMKLDRNTTMEMPRVGRTALKSILPVALEVVVGTSLLGWAMLSMPKDMEPLLRERWEDMLSVLAQYYSGYVFGAAFGTIFAVITGIVVGLLLLSAVNTAISALIGLIYMLARDGEMPRNFTRLNRYGVPWWPLGLAAILPIGVVAFSRSLESLMGLYAIGVIGAITVNLGSCTFNRNLKLHWHERAIMGATFLILFAVELTVAKTKQDALFFACLVLLVGFGLRGWAQRRAGLRTLTVSAEVAAHVEPGSAHGFKLNLSVGQTIMVAARGMTPVLKFALEEARLRQGTLYVLFVKELAVNVPGQLFKQERPRWQDDKAAAAIMYPILKLGQENEVPVVPIYVVSDNPAGTILDLAATLGVDMLLLGSPHRHGLVSLLKGNVVTEVAKNLPDNIQVIIHG